MKNMYNTQYQYTHDIDWFFMIGNQPIHCASNGGRVPNIFSAIELQNLQVEVEAIAPTHQFVLNHAVIERYVREHYRDVDEELLRRQGLPEMFKDIDFDEDTPVWMKAYSWSFVKMAQRGFLSFDRNAETGLYFLVASPADYNEFRGDVVRMMYKLPENEFPYDSIQSVRENSQEQINFVSVIERYERKGLNG